MIKAIIFDCFGVLTTEAWLAFKYAHFGNDPEKMTHATVLNHRFDARLISNKDFIGGIAELAGVREQAVSDALHGTELNEALLDFIRHGLKPHYKIGMLSNIGPDWLASMFSNDDLALFDAITLSYEIGFIKPDQRAYQAAVNRLDVTAEECIFIDDQERNVTAAKEQGMYGIVYRNTPQAIAELSKLLN